MLRPRTGSNATQDRHATGGGIVAGGDALRALLADEVRRRWWYVNYRRVRPATHEARVLTHTGETLDLVFFKPVPGCRHVQPAVEAALDLREDLPADPAAIAAVAIETYPLALAFAALPDGRDELYDRLMSVPWCVASTLLRGPLEPQALAEPSAPALTALASRVSMCAAEPFVAGYPAALGARLTVTLADGRTLTSERRLAYGEAADPALLTPPGGRLAPLDRARLLARAGGFLEPAWGAGPARRLIEGALAASALA